MRKKITISISDDILKQIDTKIDKKDFKNRSSIIEHLIRKGLNLKQDIGAVILAHENNWDDEKSNLVGPKVLIKVDGKTLLEKYLEHIKKADIKKVIISVGYEKEKIIDFIKNKNFGLDVELYECNKNDLSLKVLSDIKNKLNFNKVLILLGDNYFYPLNLTDFIYYHNSNKSELSIIVKNINSSEEYGNITLEGNNIVGFIEKPKNREELSFIINTGVYLLDINIIPEVKENLKLETDFFPNFLKLGIVKAYFHNGKYFHIQSNKILSLFN